MIKLLVLAVLPGLILFGGGKDSIFLSEQASRPAAQTSSRIEKMIAAGGAVTLEIDLNRVAGRGVREHAATQLSFSVGNDSFFTAIAADDEFRGLLPSSLPLVVQTTAPALPGRLASSANQLVVEATPYGSHYSLVVRDARTGFAYFNVEGHEYIYQPHGRFLAIRSGRLIVTKDYAADLGRSDGGNEVVGTLSIDLAMRAIEVTNVIDGQVVSESLLADTAAGTVPGPDVVVGGISGLAQFGPSDGTYVGLAVATDSCNFGTVDLNWFALPSNDHPVIPQNLYRMSGGASSDERFEQIGQSHLKHAFTALTQNLCGLGCNGVGGSRLGSGCSDPYSASLNAGPNLGSRAWVNPYTGFFPRGDSATPPNNHSGHAHPSSSHAGPHHKILTKNSDLDVPLNPGATYYVEAQYVTPHEYAHCQSNPGQCNMFNNVSYRRYSVGGASGSYTFSPAAAIERSKPAIAAWTGASLKEFQPDPGNDGVAFIAYKVTNPSQGVWRYEYAVYNQNLDRAIQSFAVPVGTGATLSNLGFHAPPQHPGWANDGTVGSAGYSSTPWTPTQGGGAVTWATETFAQNQNANAIRWGTMYNFRFESNRPPTDVNATVGFFKTGSPITVAVQGPSAAPAANVAVSGRVSTNFRGLRFARVTLSDGVATRVAYTNTFGYFRFDNVLSGQNYTVSVQRVGYTFTPQNISPSGNLNNVNFFAPRN